MDMKVDARGIATLSGFCGPGFPTTGGAFQPAFGGVQDGTLYRLNMAGGGSSDLIYSTHLGGTLGDGAFQVSLVGNGSVVASGGTQSANFPMAGSPYQASSAGATDGWIAGMDLLPDNVTRGPGSVPHCDGPIIFEVSEQPQAPGAFNLLSGNLPPSTPGLLILGNRLANCIPILGAELCVQPFVVLAVASDSAGSAVWPQSVPPIPAGSMIAVQLAWSSPSCSTTMLYSSARLEITL